MPAEALLMVMFRPAGRRLLAGMLGAIALMSPPMASAQQECGALTNAYGPYDYRSDKHRLDIVERVHFTPEVELLIRGNAGYIGGDLDYTLRAFPNHHRALLSILRYGAKLQSEHIPSAPHTVRCYFVRAVRFKPDDTTVRMLYATYLNSRQQKEEALQQLKIAKSFAEDNAFTHFNIGLVYLDLGDHTHALEQAHAAMALGFPRTELKDRLVAANRWAEPASAPRAPTPDAAPR